MLQRQGVVFGVEAGLVPLVTEAHGALIGGVPGMCLAGVAVLTEEFAVVIALEQLVMTNHPGVQRVDERLQNACGDLGMIGRCQVIADVMQQRADHHLLIGAGAQRAGGGLQAVFVAIDRIAVVIALEAPQMLKHTPAGIRLIFPEARIDQRPLGMRAFLETAEAGLLAHALASSLAN